MISGQSESFLMCISKKNCIVKKDLWQFDLDRLRILYDEEKKHLEQRLLAGATWEEVNEERKRIGELSTVIYKKSNPTQFGNPAENASRNSG